MGCGCRKKAQRRSQVVKVSGPRQPNNIAPATNSRASGGAPLRAQANKDGATGLNQGGMSAEKRRIQALRRNEILKKLGKR